MIKLKMLFLVAMALGLGLPAGPAQAQLARTWVSSLGNDGNDCNRLTPCRTFQRAHDQTLPLGEVSVLDAGGYGAVNITKGISIINDGVGEAGMLVSGGLIGITVNAGAGDHVSLRGLTVKGIGFGGGNGMRFNSGASLTIENCVVRNHTGDGIAMVGNQAANTKRTFFITNTLVSDNGGNGVYIQPTGSGVLRVVLNRVELYNNSAHGLGIAATTGSVSITATVTESVSANNGLAGFVVSAVSGTFASMGIVRSVASYNGTHGAQADGSGSLNAILRLSQNFMRDNGRDNTGAPCGSCLDWNYSGVGGLVLSYGDNVGSGRTFATETKQ